MEYGYSELRCVDSIKYTLESENLLHKKDDELVYREEFKEYVLKKRVEELHVKMIREHAELNNYYH